MRSGQLIDRSGAVYSPAPSQQRLTYGDVQQPAAAYHLHNAPMIRIEKAIAPLVGEFVGTFILVFAIGCTKLSGDPTWNPTGIACLLTALVYALAPVSGGHLNPAVSFAGALCGKMKWAVAVAYMLTQILAALLAGWAYGGLFKETVSIKPVAPFGAGEAGLVEAFFTGMYCFVFLNVWWSKRNNPEFDANQFAALAIGFVFIAGGYSSQNISGSYFNPAVSIGMDLTAFDSDFLWGGRYALFQFVGAFLAALLFRICRREDFMSDANLAEYRPPLLTRLVCEVVGTFAIAFTLGVSMVMKSNVTPWSTGAALMCMSYSLGNVSGGHFNPAVSLAVVLSGRGKCRPVDALVYSIAQIIGGIMSGLLVLKIYEAGPNKDMIFGLEPRGEFTSTQAYTVEFFFTTLLCYVVLAVATTDHQRQIFFYALAIGSCITAGGFAVGAISGGMFNPAMAFSVTMASNKEFHSGWSNCFIYSSYHLAASILAVFLFTVTHPDEYPLKDDIFSSI